MSTGLPSRRPSAKAWYGPFPILAGLSGWILLLGGWRVAAAPRLSVSTAKDDPTIESFVDLEAADSALYLRGSESSDGLLVVGDSRANADISVRVLEREGIEPAGVLTGALAQLDDLLKAARTLAPRRLLVCLSPASVYARPAQNQDFLLEQERAKSWMERVDERLDGELDVLRRRIVRPTSPAFWDDHRQGNRIDPDAQTLIYRRVLGQPTRAARNERLAWLLRELGALQRDGWSIACLRLPISPSMLELEERAFPAALFQELCERLELPYLDLAGEAYDTQDGSHLLGREADRLTVVVARWLHELPGFLP